MAAPKDSAAAKNGSKRGSPRNAVHIRADFDAFKTPSRHQSFELADRQLRVLKGYTAETGEQIQSPVDHIAYGLVDMPAQR
jgi:hypothetical protein